MAIENGREQEYSKDDIWQAVNSAVTFVQHAEAIAQSRLNNYLIADSLLLLSWATLYAGQPPGGYKLALLVMAALSAVLSFFWMILGIRQRKFLELHSDHLRTLEDLLSPSFWIGHHMMDLRDGRPIAIGSGKHLRLLWIEKWITPPMLLSLGPGVLLVFSLILVWVSCRNSGL